MRIFPGPGTRWVPAVVGQVNDFKMQALGRHLRTLPVAATGERLQL